MTLSNGPSGFAVCGSFSITSIAEVRRFYSGPAMVEESIAGQFLEGTLLKAMTSNYPRTRSLRTVIQQSKGPR